MDDDAERGIALQDTNPSSSQNDREAPPKRSLSEKVKAAKSESSGTFPFLKAMAILLIGTVGCTICIGLMLAIPIITLAIGSVYVHDCPRERYIPIYLIVAGVFGTLNVLSNMFCRCWNSRKTDEEEKSVKGNDEEKNSVKGKANPLDGILSVFHFAWFIAGNVWVYRTYGKFTTEDPSAADYCHPTCYWFAFVTITLTYIIIAFSCCCFCCLGICMACLSGDSKDESTPVNQQ